MIINAKAAAAILTNPGVWLFKTNGCRELLKTGKELNGDVYLESKYSVSDDRFVFTADDVKSSVWSLRPEKESLFLFAYKTTIKEEPLSIELILDPGRYTYSREPRRLRVSNRGVISWDVAYSLTIGGFDNIDFVTGDEHGELSTPRKVLEALAEEPAIKYSYVLADVDEQDPDRDTFVVGEFWSRSFDPDLSYLAIRICDNGTAEFLGNVDAELMEVMSPYLRRLENMFDRE